MTSAAPAVPTAPAVPAAPAVPMSIPEQVLSVVADTNLVQQVAEVADAASLAQILQNAGISGFDSETIQQSFNNISLSRNSLALADLFRDNSYYSCVRKLKAMGIETNPAEYDLIRDILNAVHDETMGADMDSAYSVEAAAEVLMAYRHYHISASFLNIMLQYCTLLDEEGIFSEDDYQQMKSYTFKDRCTQYANKLQAIGVITGLRYGLHDSFETPYLIAIAGCAAMIRQRQEKDAA